MSPARDENKAEAIAITCLSGDPTRYKQALKIFPPDRPVAMVMQL
jgi:hypothetical protein